MAWVLGWVQTHIDPPRLHDKVYVLGITGRHVTKYTSSAGTYKCNNRTYASRHAEMDYMRKVGRHRYSVHVDGTKLTGRTYKNGDYMRELLELAGHFMSLGMTADVYKDGTMIIRW